MSAQFSVADHVHMARALTLANRALNAVEPNPLVGCVIVHGEQVVGEGRHRCVGEAHAEHIALGQAGDKARGATLYVTLEPCAHHGRTPPCTEALLGAGVARVVCAMRDPDDRVNGAGIAALERGGVQVETGLLEARARDLNRGFVSRLTRGRPFVRLKFAASLDGASAMRSGESQWITGEPARADVQRLRKRAGAVLTGIGTVRADDPRLTVREESSGDWRQPLRVVLDSGLKTPVSARFLREPGASLILTAQADGSESETLREAGAEVEECRGPGGQVDLSAALAVLARRGINNVLVEAGAVLAGALIDADLVDEWVIYLAPLLLGSETRGLMQTPQLTQLARGHTLEFTEMRRVGKDLRLTAVPAER